MRIDSLLKPRVAVRGTAVLRSSAASFSAPEVSVFMKHLHSNSSFVLQMFHDTKAGAAVVVLDQFLALAFLKKKKPGKKRQIPHSDME